MKRSTCVATISAAFIAGLLASHAMPSAQAQATGPVLAPQIIDLAAMTDADLTAPSPAFGTLRSKTLVVTSSGTIALQIGDVPKHTHTGSDEIQYVISGSGTFWLGDQERQVHPGDLIVIPKGTTHAGSHPTDGKFKTIAIKLPPQAAGDTHVVQ